MTASLRVINPGMAVTLQDCGREGYQRFGVPVSGALDEVSLAIANILVGNAPQEAALEVLAAALSVTVCAECVVFAVAGTADPFVVQTAQADVRVPRFKPPLQNAATLCDFLLRRGALSSMLQQRAALMFLALSAASRPIGERRLAVTKAGLCERETICRCAGLRRPLARPFRSTCAFWRRTSCA